MPPRSALSLHAPPAFCASVDPSDQLSRSGFVDRLGAKRKISTFVEITLCAGELLPTPFARIRTDEVGIFLRQITHRSPSTTIARENRGPTGGFKPTEILPHACEWREIACAGPRTSSPTAGRARAALCLQKPGARLVISRHLERLDCLRVSGGFCTCWGVSAVAAH